MFNGETLGGDGYVYCLGYDENNMSVYVCPKSLIVYTNYVQFLYTNCTFVVLEEV